MKDAFDSFFTLAPIRKLDILEFVNEEMEWLLITIELPSFASIVSYSAMGIVSFSAKITCSFSFSSEVIWGLTNITSHLLNTKDPAKSCFEK
jgi:hypothetical protein